MKKICLIILWLFFISNISFAQEKDYLVDITTKPEDSVIKRTKETEEEVINRLTITQDELNSLTNEQECIDCLINEEEYIEINDNENMIEEWTWDNTEWEEIWVFTTKEEDFSWFLQESLELYNQVRQEPVINNTLVIRDNHNVINQKYDDSLKYTTHNTKKVEWWTNEFVNFYETFQNEWKQLTNLWFWYLFYAWWFLIIIVLVISIRLKTHKKL